MKRPRASARSACGSRSLVQPTITATVRGHLDNQAGCQSTWPSGGEAVPTPRCRHTAHRPTSMTRTQGRECSASSVGAILSHRSARVDPLQLGARCASCVFSSATGTPGRTSWFSPDWRSRPAIQSTSATRTATAPTRRRKSHCRASQAQDRQTRWRLVDPCHAAGLHAGVSVLGALINTALISLVVHAVRRRRSRA